MVYFSQKAGVNFVILPIDKLIRRGGKIALYNVSRVLTMKKFKKLTALLLAGAMTMLLLASCNGGGGGKRGFLFPFIAKKSA